MAKGGGLKRWLGILGVLALVGALLFAGVTVAQQYGAAKSRERILATLDEQLPDERVHAIPGVPKASFFMPALNVAGHDYVGIVELPDRGVRLPVMTDWTKESVRLTAGVYHGTASTGNLVIGGNNTFGQFRTLVQVDDGEEAIFTDITGAEYHYEVTSVETIPTADFDKLLDKKEAWQLVLFAPSFSGIQQTVIRFKSI